MSLIGCVTRRILSSVEIDAYRAVAQRINPIFRDFSMKMYDKIEMRKLHKELCFNMFKTTEQIKQANVSLFKVPVKIQEAMREFLELNQLLLEGHIALAADLSRTFYISRKNEMYEYDDYLQEACLAMRDAAFCYDGSTIFSTYAYKPIQRRLIDLANQSRLAPDIREDSQNIHNLLNQGKNFDEAVLELAIDDDRADRIRAYRESSSRRFVTNQDVLEIESLSISSCDKDPFETQELWQVYQTTVLCKIERIAIQAYLNNEVMRDVAADNNVTPQAMSQALQRALTKIKTQYDLQCAENLSDAKERKAA